MSGETKVDISGWTIDTLRYYLEAKRDDLEKNLMAEIQHAKDTIQATAQASALAIQKAEVSTEGKFASVNEFRAALGDQAERMMPRVESESRHIATQEKIEQLSLSNMARYDALGVRIDELNRRMLLREGAETGTKENKQSNVAVISVIVAVVGALSGVVGSILARPVLSAPSGPGYVQQQASPLPSPQSPTDVRIIRPDGQR